MIEDNPYCERFDVYYDKNTGEPLEKKCSDKNCEYCSERPDNLKEICQKCRFEMIDGNICKGLKDE